MTFILDLLSAGWRWAGPQGHTGVQCQGPGSRATPAVRESKPASRQQAAAGVRALPGPPHLALGSRVRQQLEFVPFYSSRPLKLSRPGGPSAYNFF